MSRFDLLSWCRLKDASLLQHGFTALASAQLSDLVAGYSSPDESWCRLQYLVRKVGGLPVHVKELDHNLRL